VVHRKTLDGPDAGSTRYTVPPEFFLPDPDGADDPYPRHHDAVHCYHDTGFIGGMQVPEENVRQAAVICELTVYKTFAVFF
jgi:hypothetical protein